MMSEQERRGGAGAARAWLAVLGVLGIALALAASASAGTAQPSVATERAGADTSAFGLSPGSGLVARLLRRDPAARLGGNTQVATGAGAVLAGVPGRVNFIIGLGRHQRIVGGRGHDQLGAWGDGARIRGGRGNDLIHGARGRQVISGGRGHDLIFGGPGDDDLYGGPGDDRMVDRQGATRVIPGSGENSVDIADGDGDERVVCASGSINHIKADRGDFIHPRCRGGRSTLRYLRPAGARPAAHLRQTQAVSGNGTHDNPYIAACDNETKDPCVISAFAARSLSGLWANEFVPAYKCPTSHPYLYDHEYGPFGSALLGGVEVSGLGPIGVSITGFFSVDLLDVFRITGADTGTFNSSATNWTTGTNSYQVKLHCTKSVDLGFGGPR
jgi:RTX calcium-binding nonapeptide repeat (4 copies)